MRMPSHTTLCSAMFSLLLTSAMIPSSTNASLAAAGAPAAQMAAAAVLNGLRAEGLPGSAALTLPSPAATPASASPSKAPTSGPTLTPEIMAKLLKLVADKGVDRDLNQSVAITLGLVSANQTWPCRSVHFTENNGTGHTIFISRGAAQDLVFAMAVPSKLIYGYRANRDGTATAAFTFDPQTHQLTKLTPDEAQKSLDVQVAFWTDLAVNTVTASNN